MSGMVLTTVCNHCGQEKVCHVWNGDKVTFNHHCKGPQPFEDGAIKLDFAPERRPF